MILMLQVSLLDMFLTIPIIVAFEPIKMATSIDQSCWDGSAMRSMGCTPHSCIFCRKCVGPDLLSILYLLTQEYYVWSHFVVSREDICVDGVANDGSNRGSKVLMNKFTTLCDADPRVAKAPMMLCSSDWKVVKEGRKAYPLGLARAETSVCMTSSTRTTHMVSWPLNIK